MPSSSPWWKRAVVYQIYPRSFADGNADGVGDLAGIRRRLDHLVWLGVDALWLSPVYRSPMADFGYDVSDFCDVDPCFGTLAELDGLIADAHARGVRVLLDWVPNHTSEQHPWFVASRSSRTDPKRDWYVWRDPAPDGGPPNNWVAAFDRTAPAWTLDAKSGQYYLHSFLPQQPDLDWSNPAVVAAMHDVLRFWMDRGVDGFRIDVVHCLGKDPTLPDDPAELAGIPHAVLNHHPSTQAIVRGLRRLADGYPGDRMLVGEVFLLFVREVADYYADGGGLHLAFDLPATLYTPWDAAAWRERTETIARTLRGWPTLVLSNHDTPRHRTRLGGTEARARAAAVLLLTLPGTPFLYAGEELGLEDATIPTDRVVDPGGRDGCRAPVPWDASPGHGWGPSPWLPWAPEPETRNVETLRDDPSSILHLYRRLLAARRASPALSEGEWTALEAPDGVFAYARTHDGDRRVVAVNFTDDVVPWDGQGVVEVASDGGGEGAPFGGVIGASQGLVLRGN